MKDKWPFGLTLKLWNLADQTDNIFPPKTFEIDWGNSMRGQGKRCNGMVKGGMGDAPKGIKTYINLTGNVPMTEEERKECCFDYDYLTLRYLKARSAGICHLASMTYAYCESIEKFQNKLKEKENENY